MTKHAKTETCQQKAKLKSADTSLIIKQGVIVMAKNVLLPDNTRAAEMTCGDPATGEFRRKTTDGRWVYGTIVNTPKELVFQDSPTQTSTCSYPDNPLAAQLNSDPSFKELVADKDVADEIHSGLSGKTWTNGKAFCCFNYVEAGKFVAHLRGKGECYSDFLFVGRPGFITENTLEILEERGWYPTNPDVIPENPELATRIVAECEKREHKQIEPWVYYYHEYTFSGDDEMGRMKRCCSNGQVTLTEWELFYLNFEL